MLNKLAEKNNVSFLGSPDFVSLKYLTLESLLNHESDGSKNVEKEAKQQLCTFVTLFSTFVLQLCMFITHFCTPSLHDYDVKMHA